MFRKNVSACGMCAIVLLALAAGTIGTSAQYAQRKPVEGADKNPLTGHLVKTGLYMFSGGSNSLLRLSANGLIVVDGQPAGNYDALVEQVKKISEHPIRLLIATDHHDHRTGSIAQFVADGTPVLAHENVRQNLIDAVPAGGKIATLVKTYDRDFKLTLGGIDVQVMHFGNAHTNGDSVVYFPNLKVVAVGDLFAATPDPDFSSGGSLVGWGPVLAEILKLDFDLVVPGTGPAVTRADLVAFKTKMDTLVSRAAGLVKKGIAKDQLMEQLKTDDLGWRFAFVGAPLDSFYAELSRTK